MSTSSTLLEFVAPIEPDLLAMGEALAQELVTDDPSVAEMGELAVTGGTSQRQFIS